MRRASPAVRGAAAVVLGLTGLLAVVTSASGLAWIGQPFPGFLVLRNRVVASVSLPGWPAAARPGVLQATVVAVDGHPVARTEDLYALVAGHLPGTRFAYTFERAGEQTVEEIESR